MKELYESEKVGKVKKPEDGKKAEKKIRKYGNAYRVLVKPLVTEKATDLGGQNKYVFAVSSKANKIEIAKAINEVYGIKPVAVNIIKMQGKKTRYGKITGRTKDWKKAIITLPEGETIKVYEGV
ncbi:50S ribosomal protein L23 [Candidatus Parcubacteria bacterium]|nr:50S ribosomal protein L23 [Candidatus Parcubacteria bacterium]